VLKKNLLFIVGAFVFFISCSSDYEKRLKISATTWVGYTPLFYAKEKGWLQPLNIKLVHLSSLAENMYLYSAGNSDAYVGTQYEYEVLSKEMDSLIPIMMFDKSNGGDVVMSNFSIEELQSTLAPINIYLEIDSINSKLIKDFLSKYNLLEKKINYINEDQTTIKLLKSNEKATLIVTYLPYNFLLEKNGFKEIASTKESVDLLIVDAMFTKVEVYNEHKQQFRELKKLMNKSVEALNKDPREFYNTVKPYMLDISYEEFVDTLNDIVWINQGMSNELKNRLNTTGFPTRDLI